MRLTIVGCAGSYSGPKSPSSCYLVRSEHEGRTWNLLLDLGSGALGALHRHIDPGDLDAVMISHLHPDHCVDLCGLYVTRKYAPTGPVQGRLPVYGPEGTSNRMTMMYHGLPAPGMAQEFDFRTLVDDFRVTIGPFAVTVRRVNHPIETYGFRVEADGAVLAYSGDTDTTPTLTPLFTGADLVLCDSAFVDGRDEFPGVHLSGSRAAKAALEAGGVKRLMITHLPAWNDPEVCRAQAAAVWPGEVELARPDATYEI